MNKEQKKTMETAVVLQNRELAPGIFDLILSAPAVSGQAAPGQFVEVYPDDGAHVLPRPISICGYGEGTLRLVYQVVGAGTALFSRKRPGDSLRILGPLGRGFRPRGNRHILIGGGIGVPPMLALAKTLEGDVSVYLGFRHTPILAAEFEELGCAVHIATDDGSVGFCGNAVELAKDALPGAAGVYACGPRPMLKALAALAPEAQLSLEERMACGIGVCVGCVVKIQKPGEATWHHQKVCKDGPVFLAREVVWDD